MSIPFDAYETVIGFECHVQLNTRSKLFSSGPNIFGKSPNSLVDIVDAGLPGVLPTINQEAVNSAIILGLALNCDVRRVSEFSRKHYFYPDLPKGYQISQFDKPICERGTLTYYVDGAQKSLRITRIHIEEDAGKNTHIEGINASYVDFNRAGTPLLEVVSEPDLRGPKEAMAAFKALRQLVTFLGICDGNMQEGSLRADVNVSVRRRGDDILGTRTETKNLNSFKFLGQAISFEARRQVMELESGNRIKQETRLWDPNAKESRAMRSKEEAHDYRYFPDPDLPALCLSEALITRAQQELPELPLEKFRRYQQEYGLSAYDAEILSDAKEVAHYFEEAVAHHNHPKSIANWIINEVMRSAKSADHEREETATFAPKVKAVALAELVTLVDEALVSSSIAKRIFAIMEKHPDKSPSQIVDEEGLKVVSNTDELMGMVEKVLGENGAEVNKYLDGKTKVLGFLMGELMKLSKGKADPKSANRLMLEALEKRKKLLP